jgi:hypothetical protein
MTVDVVRYLAVSRAVRAAIAMVIKRDAPIESAITAAVAAILAPVQATPRPLGSVAAERPIVVNAAARDRQSAALLQEMDEAAAEYGDRAAATIVARRHCVDPLERESLAQRLRRLRVRRNAQSSDRAADDEILGP